jgi:hypothetical protein
MPAGKFLGIVGKVAKAIPIEPSARVTFEVSDGIRAMALYRAESIVVDCEVIRVGLKPRPASCKPRDRWLEKQQAEACCKPSAKPCCG